MFKKSNSTAKTKLTALQNAHTEAKNQFAAPSDISQSKRLDGSDDTRLYENESFYFADSNIESDASSTTPTDMDDILAVDQLLKNATKKLNAKVLSKKEKILKSISEDYEKLKENAQWSNRLNFEGLRISNLISDLMKDVSTQPQIKVDTEPAVLVKDTEKNVEIGEKVKRKIHQERSLNSLSTQVARLQEELNALQEDIMYFGQPDSPKKQSPNIILPHSVSESVVAPEPRKESLAATNEPDGMHSFDTDF